ncbi:MULTISPECIES: hypothetical protein [Photobacterium]|uniref:Uncharacterized protein n=1 Tax=Photobacterium carnosum TaxID=2023717 RepID=A0A2N4UMM4_9GAMM|nr:MULTISPECIES: hypothetical protein [Photobacterium]KAE8175744.1 hypothetical protein CIT27_16930 [Photobacterium carnosum]MBY3790388.1 hypothetical protein [Photobacterium carnosum]MCD9481328.1 hypothetical protein [Photobacterium phosphoreum]MCD9485407.1 hypothetical protein [Photobacterium phosphoreum]MCD9513005.1 hypothetical protein [Photobacterium phosphoreum]
MNNFQQKRINSAVRSAENKQHAVCNLISNILTNTFLQTESITTLQTNIKYSCKDGVFTKVRVNRRNHLYFGYDR